MVCLTALQMKKVQNCCNSTVKINRWALAQRVSMAEVAWIPKSMQRSLLLVQDRSVVVLSGADLNAIRSVTSKTYNPSLNNGPKGTLFATPGSVLEKQALSELEEMQVILLI